MYRKTGFWIAIFLTLITLGILGIVAGKGSQGKSALIFRGEELLYRINLELVAVPYEISVESETGSNTILVETNRISVIDASCPDLVCVHHAPLPESLTPIVCLPNKLVIKMEEK